MNSNHPIIVYGIKELYFKTILHPNCLVYPMCVYAYEMYRNEILIPVYGIQCDFDEEKGVCYVKEDKKKEVDVLFEKLLKSGKNAKIGFFPVHKNNFDYRYKTYFVED